MEILSDVVNYLLSLGAAIFVPIIIIIAGLIIRMKSKDVISAGITLGVMFTGMTVLINFMMGTISPAAEVILENTGVPLPIIDGGWVTVSTISWSWPYALLMFPLMIVINIIMLAIKKTNTFNADLWNVWGKIFTAVGVVTITGSVLLAFLVATIQIVSELETADVHQRRIEELSGIPGIACTHKMVLFGALMYPVDCPLKKISVFNKEFDAAALKDKIGIFTENHALGFILGVIFGLLAQYPVAETSMLAVQCAAALTLFPVIVKYFIQALSPISETVSDFMNKKFKGRTLLVGLNWSFLGSSDKIRLAVTWFASTTLICAVLLPGSAILPSARVINITLAVPAYLVTKGDPPRMLILHTLGVPTFLWVGTTFAPFITDLANITGAAALKAGEVVSNSSIDGPVLTYATSQVFDVISDSWIPITVLLVQVTYYAFYHRVLNKENRLAGVKDSNTKAAGEQACLLLIREVSLSC